MLDRQQYIKVLILCCISLLDSLGYNLFLNVLPVLADPNDPLHFVGGEDIPSGTAYSIFQFAFCFGVALFPPFLGRLSDRVGRRPLLLFALSVLGIGYYVQSIAERFWIFSAARLLCGFSGCLRPLAIAYIVDMVREDSLRNKLITSLSLLSAFAVGFAPALGAHLLLLGKGYPFLFMSVFTLINIFSTYLFLPESKEKRISPSMPPTPTNTHIRKPCKFQWTYRYLLFLGFTTYFMAMAAASAFPLSLKEQFQLDPLRAGLCSLADGPLIFLSNFFFMHRLTTLSSGCKASIIAASSFCLIALVPLVVASNNLGLFLILKYSTSIGGPIVFSAIAQTMMGVCPQNVCGSYAGMLTCVHGAGRLTATALVGPLFHRNSSSVYQIVAITGAVSAIVFSLLYKDLKKTLSQTQLKTPLLSRTDDDSTPPMSRTISLMYPPTPSGDGKIDYGN